MMFKRGRWVHPSTHRIVAWLPNSPPTRGDIITVDGERHRVLKSIVRWDELDWTIDGIKVKPL